MKQTFNPETVTLPAELAGRQWLTFGEFGSLVGVGSEAVRRWVRLGIVKATKFTPRCRMIPVSEVDRLKNGLLFKDNDTGNKTPDQIKP